MKEKALREKAVLDQQRAAKRQDMLQQAPFLRGVLSGAFINSGLGTAVTTGSRALAPSDSSKSSEPSPAPKPSSGLVGGALNLGKQLTSDISKMGKTILNGNANVASIAKALPPSLLSAAPVVPLVTSVLSGANALSGSPQRADDRGGWLGKALNFGNNLVNQAKSFGQSALQLGSNAWNGAAQWVSKHKAEIAIGVGVVALAAATIATGGAALAVAGAVGAGGLGALATGSTATALGMVALGGMAGGAGLNLALQGKQIKDGAIDPTTGQKKTDLNFGDVVKSGLIGGVVAPAAAVGAGLAPAALGTWAGKGAVLGGGIDFASQMYTNKGDFSKLNYVSIAGSTASGALGGGFRIRSVWPNGVAHPRKDTWKSSTKSRSRNWLKGCIEWRWKWTDWGWGDFSPKCFQ
jgi:hypothetical protein